MVDTVVSLWFGNKGLPLLKIAAELAGKRDLKWPTRYKMADRLQNGRLVFAGQRVSFVCCCVLHGALFAA